MRAGGGLRPVGGLRLAVVLRLAVLRPAVVCGPRGFCGGPGARSARVCFSQAGSPLRGRLTSPRPSSGLLSGRSVSRPVFYVPANTGDRRLLCAARLASPRPGSSLHGPARLSAAGSPFRSRARFCTARHVSPRPGTSLHGPARLSAALLAFPRPDRFSTTRRWVIIGLERLPPGLLCSGKHGRSAFALRGSARLSTARLVSPRPGSSLRCRLAFPQSGSLLHGPARLSTARHVSPRPGTSLRSPARFSAARPLFHNPTVGYYWAGASPAPVFYVPANRADRCLLCAARLPSAARLASPRSGSSLHGPARLSAAGSSLLPAGSRAEVRNGGSRRPARSPGASDSRR